MSLTFTLTGKSSVLAVSYFPAVDMSNGDYELGLTDFETYYTLPNVNSTNNKIYFDNEEIVIPEGSYELRDIERYLKREILRPRGVKRKEDEEFPLVIRANNNTMRMRPTFLSRWVLSYEMTDILNIVGEPIFDDRIVKFEFHTYNPYANTTFGYSDEIRIPIQQQDLYTLPCESFLYIEGRLTVKKKDDETPTTLGNNCIAFMFDEIRYELNSVEIDCYRSVGIASTLKNYVSLYDKSLIALNTGWNSRSDITERYFNFCVPLNMLLGFCEDYKRVIVNARHELILIRVRNDNNCILGNSATEPEVELIKVQWRMPHVMLNEITKLSMLRALESGRYLSMSFRSWDLYEYPLLQSTTKHTWAVKTAT
ncbi:hypothetical protein ALC62_15000 [Cyphomyrmex costatus]|uniref:Double jelly roll-like domain-containing protein n=1 Tax=Cyphomyrmex costatus TaxID=456900 RepID=A0A151I898_9HYME|nr:hypothetical protein ALC62_15000 [Cyphomyrmex costatus]